MRAIVILGYGGPEALALADLPVPVCGVDDVLIEVRAVGVNPADAKWRSGMFAAMVPLAFPHVLGYDIAGIVRAGALPPGTRVVAMLDAVAQGGYAERVVIPAGAAVPIPGNLPFTTAAAIPTAGLTGAQIVEDALDVRPGQRVLLTGAIGAVGRFAVHALCARGAVIVAGVRPGQADAARALGIAEIAEIGGADWTGAPFDHVADTVGGSQVGALCRHLRPGGRIVTVATMPIVGPDLRATPEFYAVRTDPQRLRRLVDAVATGAIDVPVARVLPLAAAADAHRLVEAGGLGGKIILTP